MTSPDCEHTTLQKPQPCHRSSACCWHQRSFDSTSSVSSSRLPLCRGQRATARSLGSVFFDEGAPDTIVAACVSSRSSNRESHTSSCMIPLTPLSLVAVAHVSSCWILFLSHCWVSRSLLLFTALVLGVGDRCRGRPLLNIFFDLLDLCILPSDSSNLYRSTKATIPLSRVCSTIFLTSIESSAGEPVLHFGYTLKGPISNSAFSLRMSSPISPISPDGLRSSSWQDKLQGQFSLPPSLHLSILPPHLPQASNPFKQLHKLQTITASLLPHQSNSFSPPKAHPHLHNPPPPSTQPNIPPLLTPHSTQTTAAAPNSTPPSSTSSPTAAAAAPPGPRPSPCAATRPFTLATGMTGSMSTTPRFVLPIPIHPSSGNFRRARLETSLADADLPVRKQEDAAEVALQTLVGAPGSPPQQQQQWMGRQGVRAMGM